MLRAYAGEVHVNLGGEPDHDDSGLPPIDIVVPDDARELDRDVQAYNREQRALRRRLRRSRWSSPLARDGMIVPLLAGCLILALIAGTLLTVFTAWPGNLTGLPRSPGNSAAGTSSAGTSPTSPAAGTAHGTVVTAASPLPSARLLIGGKELAAQALKGSVLTLVPAGCACGAAVRALLLQAAQAHVPVFLVGTGTTMAVVRRLAAGTAPPKVQVAEDARDTLGTAYQRAGLTALLVDKTGSVRLARHLGGNLRLAGDLAGLAGLAASPSPAR